MDKLKILDKKIRDIFGVQGILTNAGLNLRSCGCRTLSLGFNALMLNTFNMKRDEAVSFLAEVMPEWDICYISAFPGTNQVKKVSLRKFCDHCRENYLVQKTVGINSIVVSENL